MYKRQVQDFALHTFAPSYAAADRASSYAFEGSAYLKPRFLQAWQHAYPHLLVLFTKECSGRDAWAHAARLLSKEPTEESLSALDARVGRLISSIESDATLNGANVEITTRVSEMERQLTASSLSKTSSSAEDPSSTISLKDPVGLAKLFALPAVKSLVSALDQLNTIPLEVPKVIKEILMNECPLGLIWMSGIQIKHRLFEAMLPCREKSQVTLAFKRFMCKVDGEVRMEEFDRFDNKSGECPLPNMLVMGTFATAKGIQFNPWADICAPRIAIVEGDHAVPGDCNAMATLNPLSFFCSEYMLREGAKHVVRAFSFIGLPTASTADAPGTLASALETLRQEALRIDRLPDAILDAEGTARSLVEAKEAARGILRTAGARGFMDYAERIRSLLATPAELARRPKEFVPDGCGLRTTVAKTDIILGPLEKRLNERLALNRSTPSLQPNFGISVNSEAPGTFGSSAASMVGAPCAGTPLTSPQQAASAFLAQQAMRMPPPPAPATALALPPPRAPPPPSETYVMPRPPSPSYSNLGPSASQVGSPPGVLALKDVKSEPSPRGSLASTIQYEGTGGWVQSPLGRVWCSARHAGAKVIDLKKTCFAAFLPPDMNKQAFCTLRAGCKHAMPGGYSPAWSFDRALSDAELISKRPRDEGGSRGGRGRGNYKLEQPYDYSWGGKGSWGSKGGGKGSWGGKGGGAGKGDWGGKGSWGGKGEGTGGAKGEWGYPASEKGKGKGKGKGEGGWSGRGWGY